MSQALLKHVASSSMKKRVPVLKPGYTVRVHQRIKEGSKERVQIFEGLVIKVNSGTGVNKTFTVRKVVDGIGVEKTYLIYSPNIAQIDVVKRGKVRRAKLYYMRERTGKSARLREQKLGDVAMQGEEEVEEAPQEETPAPAEETEAVAPAEEAAPVEEKAEEPKEEAAE